ncbi:methyltransferase domain-containing protein [Antarcticibacterium sp. 1MA-6-2]|uniref:SAM-dependent methyltransferase n=1 Tax=Antarcticibacterium sp. 1MA-6-2 TaxID=2908210 RepID=UPI001F1A3982|nr:methyltransferase domain-containing protein [Antarcticibacterium sp. 1MA-6-2]UJH91718.1 methyltransferase domain-containing protein [Antarcticibacterium sp. 1MA-6-2]
MKTLKMYFAAIIMILFFSPIAFAQDVVYVPTRTPVVDAMLELADVKESDVVYDLGSGDGRIVIKAAKNYGAKGVGIDIDPERIDEANANAKEAM